MSKARTHHGQLERVCPICGGTYFTWTGEIKRGSGGTCSRACYQKKQSRPKSDRFWEKVRKTEGCWIWTAANKGGKWPYGVLRTPISGESPELAHRVSWELHYGPIPSDMKVLHHCDNPPCVRPDHLFLGSPKDNALDMISKGRGIKASGENNGSARLTWENTRSIRMRYNAGNVTLKELANEFHVSVTSIWKITTNKNWLG